MKSIATLAVIGTLSMSAGCGSSHNPGKSATQSAPPPVSHTVFAPYIREIDKAKNVQKTVDAQKQAMDKQIQAQSGATITPAPAAQTP
jgi:hypothetical protein